MYVTHDDDIAQGFMVKSVRQHTEKKHGIRSDTSDREQDSGKLDKGSLPVSLQMLSCVGSYPLIWNVRGCNFPGQAGVVQGQKTVGR